MQTICHVVLWFMLALGVALPGDIKANDGVKKTLSKLNPLKKKTLSQTRIKEQIKFLKSQKKSIKSKHKDLKRTLRELLNAENDVQIMGTLLECLENDKNALSYNVISDDSMRDRKRTLEMFEMVTDKDALEVCDTTEFRDRARHIRKRTRSTESTPDLYILKRTDVSVYSEQDIRDLFDYYIAQHTRVITLYENFAREISQIEYMAKTRMKQMDINVDQEILGALTRQQALSLSQVLSLSELLLERSGGDAKTPLYSFKAIKRVNILTRQESSTDKIMVYLPSKEVDGIEPFVIGDAPLELFLPDTFRYSKTAEIKAAELETLNVDILSTSGDIESELTESIEALIIYIEAEINNLKAAR